MHSLEERFLPSLPFTEGRVVERSNDRVGRYTSDVNASVFSQMLVLRFYSILLLPLNLEEGIALTL